MRGLVLEGGGARGAYHVGVYEAMLEEGIEIDGVTGTSIGALNGAMIVQGDFEKCYEMWENLSYDMVVNIDMPTGKSFKDLDLTLDNLASLGSEITRIIKNKGLDITPLKNLIKDNIDEDRVRESDLDFGIVTVNLTDMEPLEIFKEDIPEGELRNYLLASAYLLSFSSEKIGGKRYLDGAYYDNLPFNMLIEKGYSEFILVRTYGSGIIRDISKKDVDFIVIEPSQDLGKGLNFDSETAKRNIKMGYYDAMRKFKGHAGIIYNIKTDKDEEYFFNLLASLKNSQLEEIKDLFKIKDMPGKRALFEVAMPKVAKELDLKDNASYKDLVIGMMERKAMSLGIDEFNIYEYDKFIELIKLKNKNTKPKKKGVFEHFIDKTELKPLLNMEQVVLDLADIIFEAYQPLLENKVVASLESGDNKEIDEKDKETNEDGED